MANILPSIQDDALAFLNFQQLLVLQAIVTLLQYSKKKQLNLMEIKEKYEELCSTYIVRPRSNTQIWECLQNLKNNHLIHIKINSKNTRGRSSLISLDSIPCLSFI